METTTLGKRRRTSSGLKYQYAKKKKPMGKNLVSWGGWSQMKAEFKSIETDAFFAMNNGAGVLLLNGCTRGTDIGNRVGREIMMKSIQMRFVVYADSAGINQTWHLAVVYDKQPNGVALAYTDVFRTGSGTAALRNLENRKRFRILKDWYECLSPVASDDSMKVYQWYAKCHLPVQFNSGDAGTIADIQTGSLYLVYMGSADAGTADCQMGGQVRVRFTDS